MVEASYYEATRHVNALMTASYWEIGRRIVECEQTGKARAIYGEELLKRLSADLSSRFGRGFSKRNLEQMRLFYQNWPIAQTVSALLPAAALGVTRRKSSCWSNSLCKQRFRRNTLPIRRPSHQRHDSKPYYQMKNYSPMN